MNDTKQLGVFVAFAALAWLVYRLLGPTRELIGTVTTSESYDLSPYGGSATTYPAEIKNMAQAIAWAEGFYVRDSVPQRANNPGDLKLPNTPTIANGITVFDSVDQGWNALHRQLGLILNGTSARYHLDMSIAEMGRTWTATEQSSWSANVASYLGVDVNTKLWQVMA